MSILEIILVIIGLVALNVLAIIIIIKFWPLVLLGAIVLLVEHWGFHTAAIVLSIGWLAVLIYRAESPWRKLREFWEQI